MNQRDVPLSLVVASAVLAGLWAIAALLGR